MPTVPLLMSSHCPQTVRAAMLQRQRPDDAENEKVRPRRKGGAGGTGSLLRRGRAYRLQNRHAVSRHKLSFAIF